MLRVDFDAEGRVTSASDVPEMEAAAVDPALTKAALVAVKHWTFRPETVASHGVSGAAFVPVCFRIRDEECRWKDREGGGRFVVNEPVLLNSVASVDMGKSGGGLPDRTHRLRTAFTRFLPRFWSRRLMDSATLADTVKVNTIR